MYNMKHSYIVFLAFVSVLLLSGTLGMNAETLSRRGMVSDGKPFMDHISINPKTQENDLIVKFAFNEEENSMTVSLISYRNLFVFEDNTRYRKMTPWYSRSFNPDKLSYPVDTDGSSKYAFSLELFQRVKREKGKKYVFKPWITYVGMQIQPTEYKMVNDYIEQKFDINKGGQMVKVFLHDILVMDEQVTKKKKKYVFVDYADLDRAYSIEIKRNPCFKMEEDIELEKSKIETIKTIYTSLNEQFLSDTLAVVEGGKEAFESQRILTLKQNPKEPIISECPDIQMYAEIYNSYIDSIAGLVCEEKEEVLEPEYFLTQAKKLDIFVADWQNSTSGAERTDIISKAFDVIDEVERKLEKHYANMGQLSSVISVYQRAKKYFYEVCEKGIEQYEKVGM
ncbi:MAG TPA: hypothetical protein DDY68_03600 [Porphyromonadaceae bacterium]|nr:hypothetical protein [Porphyromonadaceae bacterium]